MSTGVDNSVGIPRGGPSVEPAVVFSSPVASTSSHAAMRNRNCRLADSRSTGTWDSSRSSRRERDACS